MPVGGWIGVDSKGLAGHAIREEEWMPESNVEKHWVLTPPPGGVRKL
jgi:hypothetical protein